MFKDSTTTWLCKGNVKEQLQLQLLIGQLVWRLHSTLPVPYLDPDMGLPNATCGSSIIGDFQSSPGTPQVQASGSVKIAPLHHHAIAWLQRTKSIPFFI